MVPNALRTSLIATDAMRSSGPSGLLPARPAARSVGLAGWSISPKCRVDLALGDFAAPGRGLAIVREVEGRRLGRENTFPFIELI
jgi:hypothetical protein